MADQPVDPARDALLADLARSGVRFVLIGGAALQSRGRAYITQDVDVTPARSSQNLTRLARRLNTLDCQLIVDPADSSQNVPVPAGYFTAASLARQDIWNLQTPHGKLDITFTPAGFPDGFGQLDSHASDLQVAHTRVTVRVASLHDVEHSKRTAGRPKDLDYLRDVGRLTPPPDATPATGPPDPAATAD